MVMAQAGAALESGWTQELLDWLSVNPGWSVLFIFLIAFIESLLVVGFLIPGIFILFGIGALVGLGDLDMWPIWLGGSVGAFAGDTLSFWIGHRYRRRLEDFWPFSRYPQMLERGASFFRRHGAKSVVAGRFIGPLRPIIPASAGMLGMEPGRFVSICAVACLAWTPAYLIPGMLFGASLEVASEYAGRLALVLAGVVMIIWLTLWALRAVYTVLVAISARWLRHAIRWTRRHPILGRIAGPILDPSQPELLSVSMLGLLLVLTLWSLAFLLFLSPFGAQPEEIDQAVLNMTRSLRNHIADPFMVAVTQLSRWWVLVPTSFATLLWLLGAQRLTAAAHWLAAMAGGLLLHLLSDWVLRMTPPLVASGQGQWYAPSAALTLSTVVLGFFSVMVAKELRRRHRKWPYLASGTLLTLLMTARIYLGLDWLSGALVGAVLGLAWTAIVGIAYRQRALRPFSGAVASTIFFGTLALTTAWQISERLDQDLEALRLPLPALSLPEELWWEDGWQMLPLERTRLQMVRARQFNLQVVAPLDEFREVLEDAGWAEVQPAGWQIAVQALNPEPTERTLPLFGKDYLGHPEVMVMHYPRPSDGEQQVLRLWDSGARVQPGARALYMGQLTQDRLIRRWRLFSYWRATPIAPEEFARRIGELESLELRRVDPAYALIRAPGSRSAAGPRAGPRAAGPGRPVPAGPVSPPVPAATIPPAGNPPRPRPAAVHGESRGSSRLPVPAPAR